MLLLFCFSCAKENADNIDANNVQKDIPLYTILKPFQTNITFKNILKEGAVMNGLNYEYFYNGGGVAVGDLNGDNLIDIYFTSNLYSNKLYLNTENLRFMDVTNISGTKGGYGFPTGVTMVDINGDQKLDIYVCKSGKFSDPNKRRNELYINQGNNKQGIPIFSEQAKEYNLDLPHFSTQSSFFDYDLDGDLDMFLLNHGLQNYPIEAIEKLKNEKSKLRGERLYENRNGKYFDVTDASGIINNMLGFGLGLAIGDINNDGWPDIIIGHDYSGKDHIYLNKKDGTFSEVSEYIIKQTSYFSMGNDIADYNNDGFLDFISLDMMSENNYDIKTSMSGMNPKVFYNLVDLGLHYQYMYNTLQHNNGIDATDGLPKFSNIAQLAGVSSTDWSWGPLMIDMDNDGFKDLFIANGIKRDFRNNDYILYRKKIQKETINALKKGEKVDKDKLVMDIVSKMPKRLKSNYFFINNKDMTFSKYKNSLVDDVLTSSNGAAYADFDNDGDLDIVVNNADDLSFIYKNNTIESGGGNYLQLKLLGSKKNTDGIGARVIAKYNGKRQVLEQYFTRGFQSSSTPILHFGIGKVKTIDSLVVIWSKGYAQILENVNANQTLEINIKDANIKYDYTSLLKKEKSVFKPLSLTKAGIKFKHEENNFDDFKKESLLPHRMSRLGPALTVGDVNGDKMDDVYLGGAKGQAGKLFVQQDNGKFKIQKIKDFEEDKNHEDTSALFFDFDNDGDQDLYVVSGGYEAEWHNEYYQDRVYENIGNGKFVKRDDVIPKILGSGSIVSAIDYDKDGDLDLFVNTRVKPRHYGSNIKNYLLENKSETGKPFFEDVTKLKIPDLLEHKMITDAVWADIDNDGNSDLILATEWGSIEVYANKSNTFTNVTSSYGLDRYTGWWYSIVAKDIDQDGDTDLIAGNLGLNYKYKASNDAPFFLYVNDFDDNNSSDIVLAYTEDHTVYPLRGRECSSNQMPFIKSKYKTYDAYAKANITDVYGDKLKAGIHNKVNTFASGIFRNNGKGKFTFEIFENSAQVSSINKILIKDFNADSYLDILLLGNMYGSEVETPRNDASYGLFLKGDKKGYFHAISPSKSGLFAGGDVKDAEFIKVGSQNAVIIVKNNDEPLLVTY